MSEQLEPGMKVECIDNSNGAHALCEGAIYTIRDLHIQHGWHGVLLEEVRRPLELYRSGEQCGKEVGFMSYRFRPIHKRSTDITVFQEIDRKVFSGVGA